MTFGFAFHAAPRSGEWFNDPNGLIYAGGKYRLYMQHSRAAPDFKLIEWGAMSSLDLHSWEWDGVAVPYRDGMSAYSGSVTSTAPCEAFLTRHALRGGQAVQTQWRAISNDGISFLFDQAAIGPEGRNIRDPFVFRWPATGDWRMLLAEPCDWVGWRQSPRSVLSVWASSDRRDWRRVGTIGPFDPIGVMWEVPILLDLNDQHVLIFSTVDRRDEGAVSDVRWLAGCFDGETLLPSSVPAKVDLGPDFYAACVNTADGWPGEERVLVGWASNWATARIMPWPAGANGGPISLPRVVEWRDEQLRIRPLAAALPLATWRGSWAPGSDLGIEIEGRGCGLLFAIAKDGILSGRRYADDPRLEWNSAPLSQLQQASRVTLFLDAGLTEIFVESPGVSMTVFVPQGRVRRTEVTG